MDARHKKLDKLLAAKKAAHAAVEEGRADVARAEKALRAANTKNSDAEDALQAHLATMIEFA